MKRIFDPKRLIPVGKDWENQRTGIYWGLAWSVITTFSVLTNYFSAQRSLYERLDETGELVLVEGRTIAPFWTMVNDTAFSGLIVFLIAMALLVYRNYLYHRQGSMSVYLMKRLPDKWELHRRCWAVPIGASLMAVALVALMIGIFYIIYLTCTPAQCLPG